MALAAVVLLAACGPSAAPPPASPAQGRLAINSVELAFVSRAFGASLPVVVIDLTVENRSTQTLSLSRSQFEATDSNGELHSPVVTRGTSICHDPEYIEPALAYGDIRPGEAVRGRMAFSVLPGARLVKLIWTYGLSGSEASVELPDARVGCEP